MKFEGKDWTATVEGDKLLIERQGKLRVVRQAAKLRGGPSALFEIFTGPNRNFLLSALSGSKDLMVVVKRALSENKSAALEAFRQNDTLLKSWLKDHRELIGILLEGDIHVFVNDVAAVENEIGWRKGVLSIHVDGAKDPVEIEYAKDKKGEFEQLYRLLGGE